MQRFLPLLKNWEKLNLECVLGKKHLFVWWPLLVNTLLTELNWVIDQTWFSRGREIERGRGVPWACPLHEGALGQFKIGQQKRREEEPPEAPEFPQPTLRSGKPVWTSAPPVQLAPALRPASGPCLGPWPGVSLVWGRLPGPVTKLPEPATPTCSTLFKESSDKYFQPWVDEEGTRQSQGRQALCQCKSSGSGQQL